MYIRITPIFEEWVFLSLRFPYSNRYRLDKIPPFIPHSYPTTSIFTFSMSISRSFLPGAHGVFIIELPNWTGYGLAFLKTCSSSLSFAQGSHCFFMMVWSSYYPGKLLWYFLSDINLIICISFLFDIIFLTKDTNSNKILTYSARSFSPLYIRHLS